MEKMDAENLHMVAEALVKVYPDDLYSAPSLDVELETWVEPTIEKEIARGELLQKQKSVSGRINNLVYVKSPRLAKGGVLNRRKSPIRKRRRSPSSPIMKRMSPSTSRDESYISYRNPRMGRPVCSMRISELAAPTKRQCIASWRANSKILPGDMINRLKKRVTDQEPIVKVSDAVNCIKQVKRPSDTRGTVIEQKRPAKKLTKAEINKRKCAETQVLSDVFARKIIPKLMKPMSISLNSRLKKVSDIISEEIYNIIKDKKTLRTNKPNNERILHEISEKVTVWIARILDDSAEKLLEEELKELEEQEGPALDVLDEIVDDVLHKYIRTPSDNATPDFISVSSEDKVYRPDYEDSTQGEQQNDDSESVKIRIDDITQQGDEPSKKEDFEDAIENEVAGQINKLIDSLKHEDFNDDIRPEEQPSKKENSEDTIENDVVGQINRLIHDSLKHEDFNDDIHPEEQDIKVLNSKDKIMLQLSANENKDILETLPNIDASDTTYANVVEDGQNIEKNKAPITLISDPPDLTDLTENNKMPLITRQSVENTEIKIKQDQDDVNDTMEDNNSVASEINENIETLPNAHDSNEQENTNEKESSNVSDAIEVVTAELSEEQNKKVQFSRENLGSMIDNFYGEQQKPINSDNAQSEDEQLLHNIGFEKSLSNISFAALNEHLLSNADESWPDDVTATRTIASVIKSVSSMGKILEADEQYSISLDDTESSSQPKENNTEEINDNNKETNQFVVQNKDDNSSQNTSKIHVRSDKEKSHHDDAQYTREITPLEQVEQFEELDGAIDFVKDAAHVEVQNYDIHETGDKENNPYEDSHHKIAITPLEEFEELGLLIDLDTTHNINVRQKDNIDVLLSPFTAAKNSAKLAQKESIVVISNGDFQDFRNQRDQSKPTEHTDEVSSKGHQRRASADVTFKKFDYRVHHKTAPSWIRRGQGEPTDAVQTCACTPFRQPTSATRIHHPAHPATTRMEEREQEIRKWCQELDFIVKNLDNWKNWLNYVSKYITGLKQKADGKDVRESRHRSRRTVDRLMKSFSPTDNGRLRKMNKEGLKQRRYDDAAKYRISPSPVRYCKKCGRRKPSQTKRHRRYHSKSH